MSFTQAIASGFRNYVSISGRASRSEYWFWVLFIAILFFVAGVLEALANSKGILEGIAWLVILLPSFCLGIRRLHDLDRSGWWILVGLIPIVGAIVLIVWHCTKGTTGPNQFGPDPVAAQALAAA